MQTFEFIIPWPVVWLFAILSLAIAVCIVLLILWAIRRRRMRVMPDSEEAIDQQEQQEKTQACLRCGTQVAVAFQFCPACGKVLVR